METLPRHIREFNNPKNNKMNIVVSGGNFGVEVSIIKMVEWEDTMLTWILVSIDIGVEFLNMAEEAMLVVF